MTVSIDLIIFSFSFYLPIHQVFVILRDGNSPVHPFIDNHSPNKKTSPPLTPAMVCLAPYSDFNNLLFPLPRLLPHPLLPDPLLSPLPPAKNLGRSKQLQLPSLLDVKLDRDVRPRSPLREHVHGPRPAVVRPAVEILVHHKCRHVLLPTGASTQAL